MMRHPLLNLAFVVVIRKLVVVVVVLANTSTKLFPVVASAMLIVFHVRPSVSCTKTFDALKP